MCGILGLLCVPDSPLDGATVRRSVKRLFQLSESRGKESSGIAARVGGRIHVHKEPRSASFLTRSREYAQIVSAVASSREARCIIGHSRMATNGSPDENHNNHPVVLNGLVGVHNGIVTNDAQLWQHLPGRAPALETDTEALLAVLGHHVAETGALQVGASRTFAQVEGMASIAVLFAHTNKLLLATNTGSLHVYGGRDDRLFLFASEDYFLRSLLRQRLFRAEPERIVQVKPGTGYVIDLDTLDAEPFELARPDDTPDARTDRPWPIVDSSNTTPARTAPAAKGRVMPLDLAYDPDRPLRRCTRCILPETMPFITFDGDGVCNYCHDYRPARPMGDEPLRRLVEPIRSSNGRPDCIVALSGGRDSSYTLHYVKTVLGLHPVAFSYDWGMMTEMGRRNQSRLCAGTGVEHILVSADIRAKRAYIRKNVEAWLRAPDLGTVPLFMAGDKQFYRHAYHLRRQFGVKLVILGEHPLESTNFKVGFAGTKLTPDGKMAYSIPILHRLKLLAYYGRAYLTNPAYLNASLLDTLDAFFSFYVLPHDYLNLYDYVPWDEAHVVSTIMRDYKWEGSPDSTSTWRIDDGTAAFYNYIYYTVSGLSEHDTFLSNLVREGRIPRTDALATAARWNRPREASLRWYFDTIGVDIHAALGVVNRMPKLRALLPS